MREREAVSVGGRGPPYTMLALAGCTLTAADGLLVCALVMQRAEPWRNFGMIGKDEFTNSERPNFLPTRGKQGSAIKKTWEEEENIN